MEAGQPYEMFWRLTLREVMAVFDGTADKYRREHNDRAWSVWHTEALARSKKLPKLKTLTIQTEAVKKQSKKPDWRRDFAAFSAWAESYKGKS